MRCLACDPSTKALGFCLWDSAMGKFFTMKLTGDFGEIVLWLETYLRGIEAPPKGDRSDQHFFCEDQYTGPNRQTGIKIATMRGVVNAAAYRHGWRMHDPVKAKHWQGALLGLVGKTTYDQRKARAKEIASMIFKKPVLDSDVADAICICEWAKNRLETKERLGV